MRILLLALIAGAAVGQAPSTPGGTWTLEAQEIRTQFGVGYAVTVADVNGDKRADVVAINGTQLVWFENPSWQMHVVLDGQTPKDNVTIAPHDIDGDGRLDIALGAAWNPRDTKGGGTLHWVQQPASGGKWTLRDLGSEPTLHRIRWASVDGPGRPALIVTPLHGRGTEPPEWNGPGARILVYRVPGNAAGEPWPTEVADDTLHILHNFLPVDLDGDRRDELVMASREGLHVLKRDVKGAWTRTKIGEGAPGEIKVGRLHGKRAMATVEPWHGQSFVVYLEPPQGAPAGTLWTRRVLDDRVAGGHALAWADLDGDGHDELIAGWRDGDQPGVVAYGFDREGSVRARSMVDAGGMATEDLAVGDFDADGRPDLVASGRKTANVKIYWNRTKR
jgi:hypothetical protein